MLSCILVFNDRTFCCCLSFFYNSLYSFWRVRIYYLFSLIIFLYFSSFRIHVRGSTCLFSKYLIHFLEGEDVEDLDISKEGSNSNVFTKINNLSSGWKGTCEAKLAINNIKTNYSQYITSLNSAFEKSSTLTEGSHQITLNNYEKTVSSFNEISKISSIPATLRPSEISQELIPEFENQFKISEEQSTIGGEMNSIFQNYLQNYVETLKNDISPSITTLSKGDNLSNNIVTASNAMSNFDSTVATATQVLSKNFLNMSDDLLGPFQFQFEFISCAYLIFFVFTMVFLIIYICKTNKIIYIILVILLNFLLILCVYEDVLAALFGGARLVLHEGPRILTYIFTGSYMTEGNNGYPAKFGNGDKTQAELFDICLNGDGDLSKKFFPQSILESFIPQEQNIKNKINNLYQNVQKCVDNSNILTTPYDSLDNSIFVSTIIKLEEMKKNIFIASEDFGDDDIFSLLNNIKNHLSTPNCDKENEKFVIKSSDCQGIQTFTTIQSDPNPHCYVIQDLVDGEKVNYPNESCKNDYTNKVITFVKKVDELLTERIKKVKQLQENFSNTWGALYKEISMLNNNINSLHFIINNQISNEIKSKTNCSSVRFDLINFSDYYANGTQYKAKIIVIFAAFIGSIGWALLYFIMIVINMQTKTIDTDSDYEEYGYRYKSNRRNNGFKGNKSKTYYQKNNEDYEKDDNDEDDDYKNAPKKTNKTINPPKNLQKVEMTYLNKSEESDSD